MTPIVLTKGQLRLFILYYQGLIDKQQATIEASKFDAVETLVKRLGCIQYDPLNVVGKNPDLVLQSRILGYKQGDIDYLLYNKRSLIDAWDKMMSIYSAEDFPKFTRLRARKAIEIENTLKFRGSEAATDFIDQAIEIISSRGPLLASQIDFGKTSKGVWGHGKLSSATLDYLYNIGKLGIHSRRNTQKVYDLIENLHGEDLLSVTDPFDSEESFVKWYVKRRIGSIGAYWAKSGGGWLGHFIYKSDVRKRLIHEMVAEKSLIKLHVADIKEPFYMRSEDYPLLEASLTLDVETTKSAIKFIAPLDNLLWDRGLVKLLFDFDYVWEVYKPIKDRKHGYYVLPVLHGDKIVARFEPKLYRKDEPFTIDKWWWEADTVVDEQLISACKQGIVNFASYLEADPSAALQIFDDYSINNRMAGKNGN